MSIRPQVLGCFCPLDESLSSAYSLSFSTCQLSVGSWFVWEIALSKSSPAVSTGYLGWSWKYDFPKFFSFCTRLFKFKFITKFGSKKYDVPLFSVSFCDSYSKRAVVWRIELNIILQYIKITYWIKHEVAIR